MVARLHGSPALGREYASGHAAFLEYVINVFQHQLVGLGEEAVDYWYPAETKDGEDNERVPLRCVSKYSIVHVWELERERVILVKKRGASSLRLYYQ
jgi:hypothetical protein